MALIAADTNNSAQGIIKIFSFATTLVDNADTFTGPASPKAMWVNNNTDNVLVTVAESSGTYTFTVAAAGVNKDVTLFVIE